MDVLQLDLRELPQQRPPVTLGAEEVTAGLRRDVAILAGEIGERNLRDSRRRCALEEAREYIATELAASGHKVHREPYFVHDATVENIQIEIAGTDKAKEIVLVGAHYDTAKNTPGANDNASGVAALLAIARSAATTIGRRRTLRLVAFCTEEPPFTRTPAMGSWVHARACRRRGDAIVGMLSLETLGYYADSHRAEHAPFPLNYLSPWRADFLAVMGDLRSRELVAQVAGAIDEAGAVRCKSAALPGVLPGVRSSDQWSFWKEGYRAAMLTDTAWLRYRHYHRPSDTPEKLDFPRLAQVTSGVARALHRLTTT